MRNQLLVSLALVVAASCSKSDSTGSSGGKGGAGKPAGSKKIDTAKLGAACSMQFDCGDLDLDSDCSWSCVKPPDDDKAPGYCRLTTLATTAGAKGCYGNHRGVESSGSMPSEKLTQLVYCDMNAGVYCNEGTHACEAVKAPGTACATSDECGKDGACQNKQCVAAGAAGAAPVEGRCQSAAYRKGDQCLARVADGQPCEESDQCQSLSCVYGTTKVCQPAKSAHCAP